MARAAINKPIYDAFLDAGASEGKAAAAARAILPSVEDAATKADVTLLKTDITLLRADMEQFRTETKADSDLLRAGIERLENSTKKDCRVKGGFAQMDGNHVRAGGCCHWVAGEFVMRTLAVIPVVPCL